MTKSAEGLGSDCGTGVGDTRADQLRNDEVGPDVVEEVAAYLTSHEEDVTAEGPPSEWSDEEWDDCGNIQYAKWGGDGSGDALEWAQDRANAVADARDEEMPYPNRNLDDPAYAEGDAVAWDWQGDTVHGRVADRGEQFTVGGNTITGEEGEAVYLIHEWDEEVEAFRRENVAKPESSLSDSQIDMPPASEENFQAMTDDDTGDSDAGTTDDEQDGGDAETTRAPADIGEDDVCEFLAEVYDGVEASDIKDVMADAGAEFAGLSPDTAAWFIGDILDIPASEVGDMMDGDGDEQGEYGDDEDEEEDEEMSADDPESEQSADDGDDLRERIAALEDELESVRSGETEVNTPETDEEQATEDTTDDRATAGPNWRSV
jgi:hypothetical protein